jgi:hypothetical protein
MATTPRYFSKGIELRGETSDITNNLEGSIFHNSTSSRLKTYIAAAVREIVTNDQVQTLTNKTIDASSNTISNLTTGMLASGVLNTSTTLATASDTQVPSALAVKTYVDDGLALQNDASEIAFVPNGDITSSTVQTAIVEVRDDTDTKLGLKVDKTTTVNGFALSGNVTLAKGDVGLGNVDNTSDATKNAATATLTNKTLTSPIINTPTGIVKGDVGLGNVDNTSDATKNAATATLTNKTITGASIQTPTRLDVKQDTKANLTTYALTATNGQIVFATDTKEYFAIKDTLLSDLGGGGAGVGGTDILSADQADKSATTDYTQTGLEIIETPIVLHGTKSFRLQHASSIKSFKKVIPVDRKFRGKNNTVWLDVMSTATQGNLNIVFRDETNSLDLTTSQQISTGSLSVTGTTASASNQLTALDNATVNSLKVGMVITGSAIPVGTTITAISTSSATMSQNATGVSTGIRVSALAAKQIYSFNIPANCLSLSWAISTVVEAAAESYIDDVVVQLTEFAKTSTSITIPKNNDTDWASFTATPSWASSTISGKYRRIGDTAEIQYNLSIVSPSGALTIPFPSGLAVDTSKLSSNVIGSQGEIRDVSVAVYDQLNATYSGGSIFLTYTQAGSLSNGVVSATAPVTFVTGDSINFSVRVPIAGWKSNETETTIIPLTTSQLVQESDSVLIMTGGVLGGAQGSLDFTTVSQNKGSGILYNSTLKRFYALESGVFNVSVTDETASATSNNTLYIVANINSTDIVLAEDDNNYAQGRVSCSGEVFLNVGDYIRFGANNSRGSGGTRYCTISKQGSLKQLNVSSYSKIEIPTHELRFEGASSTGSTDTAIVKFDVQAKTRGDAWDVVNTAANGTIVTMKKAGTLSVSAYIGQSAAGTLVISKNQTVLTALPPSNSEVISLDTVSASGFSGGTGASLSVNIGDKIRVSSNSPVLNGGFSLLLTENSIPSNFSNVLPQWSEGDSAVRLNTGNGFGSTNTSVRRFANTLDNLGSAITYTDSATLGASFLINETGMYNFMYNDVLQTGNSTVAVVKNNTIFVAGSDLLGRDNGTGANAEDGNVLISNQVYLIKGDIVRVISNVPANVAGASTSSQFTISKVGKPNLSSVDVTSFVNMKTTDVEAIEALTVTTTFGSVNGGVPVLNITKNTNLGVIRVDSSAANGTSFVALKDCEFKISANFETGGAAANNYLTKNATILNIATPDNRIANTTNPANSGSMVSANVKLVVGDVIRVQRNSANTITVAQVTITATADNNATATPTQQISSDTISFSFKATAITDTDAIGTFNTYTFTAATNTFVIAGTAPTQTTASMNINGVQLFGRAFNSASTSASPAKIDIVIGKGLKGRQIDGYVSVAKTQSFCYDRGHNGATAEFGTEVKYNSTTGILSIDVGYGVNASYTTRYVSTGDPLVSNGYFVFNASKSPSLVTIPNLQIRTAYLSETQNSGIDGGTNISGTQTRTLNTIVDTTGIIKNLNANIITLVAGTYNIEASIPAYSVGLHKAKFVNISDATAIIGSSEYSTSANNSTQSFISSEFTISSDKTFRLDHYTQTVKTSNGLGANTSSGDKEVYSQIKITKIK